MTRDEILAIPRTPIADNEKTSDGMCSWCHETELHSLACPNGERYKAIQNTPHGLSIPYTGHLIDELTEMVERAEDNAEACEGCGSTTGECYGWCPESRGSERAGTEFFDSTRGI